VWGQGWFVEDTAVAVFEILKEAIEKRRCVAMLADGKWREVAPLAIGFKGTQKKVLTFQYKGGSNSGLAPGGAWRCFRIDDITWAKIIDDPWQCGHYPVAKTETSFDYVVCGLGSRIRTFEHLKQRH
jgi:predicted DNA-binding transcriptional regulator YafY